MGGLPKIAFAAGEPVLLTIDGATLLAYDAVHGTAKWQLAFERPLAGVVFASMRALPRAGGNPWRSPASSCEAVAIDVRGGLYAVDATAGTLLATHAAGGVPEAAAARGDILAVALAKRVVIWREGATYELELEAAALAFARDGLTLGIATADGDLVIVDARTLAVTATHALCLDVNGLTASRYGWIVATDRDLRSVDADGVAGKVLDGPVERTALDVAGKRVAVHRSDTSITVYGWPPALPQTRIKLGKGHHLVDVAFGEGDALAVGIDRGDAAIVDVAACTAVRTEGATDLPARRWSLEIEDEATRIARARAEAHADVPPSAATGFRMGRVGFGLLATAALGLMRIVGATTRTPSWTPPPSLNPINVGQPCDSACARARLVTVDENCRDAATPGCTDRAREALLAFEAGRCDDARAELGRIDAAGAARGETLLPPLRSSLSLARRGLTTGCKNKPAPLYDPPRELVHLRGRTLSPVLDDIALRASDHPKLWAAPNGTLTLVTRGSRASCMLRAKAPNGEWTTVHDEPSCKDTSLFVRSPTEAYASFDGTILAFDGTEWKESEPALDVRIRSLSGTTNGDLYALDDARVLHRRQGTSWTTAPTTSATPDALYPGRTLLALGTTASSDDALLRWTPAGFSVRTVASFRGADAPASSPISDLWTSPTGQLFAVRGATVSRSVDEGGSWRDMPVGGLNSHIWGRSDSEVYVAGDNGIRHFDGKTWTATAFDAPVEAISGNASDLWVVVAQKP